MNKMHCDLCDAQMKEEYNPESLILLAGKEGQVVGKVVISLSISEIVSKKIELADKIDTKYEFFKSLPEMEADEEGHDVCEKCWDMILAKFKEFEL